MSTPLPGELRWKFETDDRIEAAAIEADGVIYVASRDGTLYALDAGSGSLIWDHEFGDRISSAAEMDGIVYVNSFDGHVYALNIATGDLRWKFKPRGLIWSSPVVA